MSEWSFWFSSSGVGDTHTNVTNYHRMEVHMFDSSQEIHVHADAPNTDGNLGTTKVGIHLPSRPEQSECSEPECGWHSQTGRWPRRCHVASGRTPEYPGQNSQCFPAVKRGANCSVVDLGKMNTAIYKHEHIASNYRMRSAPQHILFKSGSND